MATTTVSQLKAKLSEQLRLVQAGEEVTITDRGRPIARILPFPTAHSADESIEGLVEKGLARLPRSHLPPDFFDAPLVDDPCGALRAAAAAERAEGH